MNHVYSPEQLRTQRTSLFIHGGTREERRCWADAAADVFAHEGPLLTLEAPAQLPALLARSGGVVFVPDVLTLHSDAQARILHCLLFQEERAKWVLGLVSAPQDARDAGTLRADLWYRLRTAQLNVTGAEVQAMLRQFRSRPKAAASKAPPAKKRAG